MHHRQVMKLPKGVIESVNENYRHIVVVQVILTWSDGRTMAAGNLAARRTFDQVLPAIFHWENITRVELRSPLDGAPVASYYREDPQ